MEIPNYYRAILTTLLPLIGTLYAYAYDSKDLVGSALEYEIDPKYFMMYFQDGNILSIIFGLLCGNLLFIFRKHLNHKIRIALIAFVTTIVAASILLMILGEGYNGMAPLVVFSGFCVIGLFIFIILPGLLILWVYKSFKSKDVGQSSKVVWGLLINGFGTVPLSIVLALFAFWGANQIAKTWNLKQCEKYIQSGWKEDFRIVPELMGDWEKAHLLQWGKSAKEYYERREHPEPCDSVLEETIEINNATETND